MKWFLRCLLLIIAAGLTACKSVSHVPANHNLRIVFVSGSATNGNATAEIGQVLGSGTMLATGPDGYIDLELTGHFLMRIHPSSELRIQRSTVSGTDNDALVEVQLDLREGSLLCDVKKLAATSRFEIKHQTGVAGIRGTSFHITAKGACRVIEGTVIMIYVTNSESSPLTIQTGTSIEPPSNPGSVPPVYRTPPSMTRSLKQQLKDLRHHAMHQL